MDALAPELWRRTTIALQRTLGRLVGLQERELRRLVRISYAKVAEFQRRGAIHFYAVLRLDAATDCAVLAARPHHPSASRRRCSRASAAAGTGASAPTT